MNAESAKSPTIRDLNQYLYEVNNAGISYRATIPYIRKLERGKIINVSSIRGMLAMPTMGSYSASKYALEGICEVLWYEVRPLGHSSHES